jgi:large-conductance mechanosensitive channel
MWGSFVGNVIDFLVIAAVVYVVVERLGWDGKGEKK